MFPFIPLFFPLLLLQALKKSIVTEGDLKCVEKKKNVVFIAIFVLLYTHRGKIFDILVSGIE